MKHIVRDNIGKQLIMLNFLRVKLTEMILKNSFLFLKKILCRCYEVGFLITAKWNLSLYSLRIKGMIQIKYLGKFRV